MSIYTTKAYIIVYFGEWNRIIIKKFW